jgi:hypothetical protein
MRTQSGRTERTLHPSGCDGIAIIQLLIQHFLFNLSDDSIKYQLASGSQFGHSLIWSPSFESTSGVK